MYKHFRLSANPPQGIHNCESFAGVLIISLVSVWNNQKTSYFVMQVWFCMDCITTVRHTQITLVYATAMNKLSVILCSIWYWIWWPLTLVTVPGENGPCWTEYHYYQGKQALNSKCCKVMVSATLYWPWRKKTLSKR